MVNNSVKKIRWAYFAESAATIRENLGHAADAFARRSGKPVRTFTQPLARTPIAVDFPRIQPLFHSAKPLLALIESQLEKNGTTLAQAGRIHIAYPHKHFLKRPWHPNNALATATALQRDLKALAPHVDWVMADAFYERVHLDRSHAKGLVSTLTQKHDFGVAPSLQSAPMDFLHRAPETPAYFIMVDTSYELGTTMANFKSFIEANGGTVLAGTAHNAWDGSWDFAQMPGNMPRLGDAFAKAAQAEGMDYTPDQCLALVKDALALHHSSLEVLTQPEAFSVWTQVGHARGISFGNLLHGLNTAPRVVFRH